MWRIWFFFGILKISFAAPVETSSEDIIPSSELSVLKCLLSSPLNSCDDIKRSTEKIPKRIQKLYEKLKRPLFNASSEVLEASSLDTLPVSLLYLIPKVRLSSMTGFTASDIVRKFPFDDALTMKILSLFTDKTNIENFLNGLADREEVFFVSDDEYIEKESITEIAPISPAVEKEIALSLSIWFPNGSQWEYWLYKASMVSGTPIMASLPNYFLKSLSLETTEKFLFHLRNWRWDYSKFYDSSWSQHSMSIKRIWSSIVLNKAEPPNRWTPKLLRKFAFFLIGATPDELRELSTDLRISHDFNLLLELNWNALQARAVFDVGFSNLNELNENSLNGGKDIVISLLPRQIQQFSYNTTDFSFVKASFGISLPTEKQLFASHLAFLMSRNKTKDVSPLIWQNYIESAGKFYHLIPASSLEMFLNETLDLDTLAKTDSPALSFRQSYYLSNGGNAIDLSKPESVVKFKGILKAVPSIKLVELPSNVISHSVKEHLLMFSCGESLPFTASVLEKVRQDLVLSSYLEKMLYCKDFRKNFNLLGNRDIKDKFRDINSNLLDIVNRNPGLERNVRLLPQNTLSTLLSIHREETIREDGGWNYENLVESAIKPFISGLTCVDIEVLETSDFIPVIGYYVHQRRAMNEVFPKNMQFCSQKALTKYLKLKVSLRGLTNEPFALLEYLEPHEIRAIGGYILASLPIELINSLRSKYHIISEVGKLTIPEILTATSLENIKELTEIYISHVDIIDLRILNGLGNLVWFLNDDKVMKLNVDDFKLHLESMEENAGKALCLNEKERKAWKEMFIRTFGKPDSWSSGTLSFLGDLLFVLDSYELERINKTSWTEAADILAKSTSFYSVLEWPGKTKPIYLYESCLEILKIPERISYKNSVKQLLRYYLESAQFLLDTVSPVQSILKLNEEANLVENAQSMGFPLISTFVSSHIPEVVKPNGVSDFFDDYVYNSKEDDYDDDDDDGGDYDKDGDLTSNTKTNPEVSDRKGGSAEKTTENSFNETATLVNFDNLLTPSSVKNTSTNIPAVRKEDTLQSKNTPVENESLDSESVNIFRSESTKTLEELKEELQKNASRALIVEVPLNRSDFSNFGTAVKHNVRTSCDAIRVLGKSANLILNIEDIEHMSEVEIEDCSEVLGSLDLDKDVKKFIWRKLKKWRQSGNLMEVGSLVSAIEENEISEIPLRLSEPWALENLNVLSTHISESEMMSFITDQFLLKNMDLQSLSYESAISLGRLVCTMTLSHQRKYLLSHPEVFTNVAKTLGNSLECGSIIFDSCIQQLASLATSPEAFGETNKWTADDVSDLGVIVAGLKKSVWEENGVRTEAFAGLTPVAVSCIPPDIFKDFTNEQLLRIPTLSAAAISPEQTSSLSPSQCEIIDRVRRQTPPDDLTASFASGASSKVRQSYFTIFLSISVFFVSRTFSVV